MDNKIKIKKIFLITLIIALSISALIGIIVLLQGEFGKIQGQILGTTLAVGGFSLTGLCCANLLEKKRFDALAIFGIVVSIFGFLFVTSLIWEIIDENTFGGSKIIFKIMAITITLAISTAHSSLMLLIKSDKKIVNISMGMTILYTFLIASEIIILILGDFHELDTFWYRLLGVFAILDVLGTIVTPILVKISFLHEHHKY